MSERTSVFISYSKYDRDAAFAVKRLLEENNVRVWLDVISIKVSSQLLEELYRNIDRHETFCLLLSPTSVASPWCLKEIEHARSKADLRFVPVILRSCKIPAALENVVALDAREGLEHKSVRSRLLRALCGDGIVEDSILFTQLQQDLLANSQIVEEAESRLADIKSQVAAISNDAITKLELFVDVESLLQDGSVVELRLKLDTWKLHMSIFIAVYQEDGTWPERFSFEELEYTEFYKEMISKIDVRFKWRDYTEKVTQAVTSDDQLARFMIEFDGHEFRPGGALPMPAKFEVPSLAELARHWSQIDMFLHSQVDQPPKLVAEETDINLEMFGMVRKRSIRLYRSKRSHKQQILAECPSIIAESNLIWKEALVYGCDPNDTLEESRAPLQDISTHTLAALDDLETDWPNYSFSSLDERRLVAHELRLRGRIDHELHSQYRDAFIRLISAQSLFESVFSLAPTGRFDLIAMENCYCLMIETCLLQQSFEMAVEIGTSLKHFLRSLVEANDDDTDLVRMLAEASLLYAEIMHNVQQVEEALSELDTSVRIYRALYEALPSQQRRIDYIETLQSAINSSRLWNLGPSDLIQDWTAAMRQDVGDEAAVQLLRFTDPDVLPTWLLTPTTRPSWPVSPIHSATLRYALNVPRKWVQEPLVRGTSVQIEHVYWGDAAQNADWLCIDFMGNIQEGYHSFTWLDTSMMISGLPMTPVHDDPERGPKKEHRSWTSLGTIQGLKERLKADEVYGWIGLFEYQREQYILLGRVYALVVRRGTFGWKIVLSFATKVPPGTMEEDTLLEDHDHVRAGAVLGGLRLDGIPSEEEMTSDEANLVQDSDFEVDNAGFLDGNDHGNLTLLRTSIRDAAAFRNNHRKVWFSPTDTVSPGWRYGALPDFRLKYIYSYGGNSTT